MMSHASSHGQGAGWGGASEKDSAGRFLNFSTEELGTKSKKEKHWVFSVFKKFKKYLSPFN
jgi:hypothetical protein